MGKWPADSDVGNLCGQSNGITKKKDDPKSMSPFTEELVIINFHITSK